MKKIIFSDIKTLLRSRNFWIAVGAIIACSLLNLVQTLQTDDSARFGGLGLFIYAQYGNHLINTLAPFIPAFIFMPLVAKDIRSADFMSAYEIGPKKHLAGRAMSSMIAGGGVFIIAFLVILIGFFIYDPTVQTIKYVPTGLFSEVYNSSPLAYISLFMVYSALYGAIYGFFGFAVGFASKSVSMAMVLPGLIYHYANLIWYIFEGTPLSFISLLLPNLTYVFAGMQSPTLYIDKALQLGIILLTGITLVITGYWRLEKKQDKCDEKLKKAAEKAKPPFET